MAFELIQDDNLYRRVAPNPAGQYIDRVWVEFDYTIETFAGLWSPYKEGETSFTLPEGVDSQDTIIIHTEDVLSTDDSSEGNESTADVIYLGNPDTNPNEPKYIIKKASIWKSNSSFQLIQPFNEYLAVRVRAS